MTTDRLLTLAQLFSPSFPIGAFAYSHGLETVVADGVVRDAGTFHDWAAGVLTHGAGRADSVQLVAAFRAENATAVAAADALARALAPSRERLLETEKQGAAFADTASRVWDLAVPPLAYPIAVGCVARLLDLPLSDVLRLYLHAFAANLTAAATRVVPLGQTEAQGVLRRLTPLCEDLARDALAADTDDIGSASFAADIASMRHETQYSRLFRS